MVISPTIHKRLVTGNFLILSFYICPPRDPRVRAEKEEEKRKKTVAKEARIREAEAKSERIRAEETAKK